MGRTVAIVMAAGKGTRMNSVLPKVLIEVAGRPMIDYVLDTLAAAGVDETVVVVGYEQNRIRSHLAGRSSVRFVEQTQQLGTGHAVMVCEPALKEHDGPVVVVAGDSPMMRADSLRALLGEFAKRRPACLLGTAEKENPLGLGRIVRDDDGRFVNIVEEKDATPEQRRIREVNLSCYVFNCRDLFEGLAQIRPDNAQSEYYLTDCPRLLLKRGLDVQALPILKPSEALSINTPEELKVVEAALQSGANA